MRFERVTYTAFADDIRDFFKVRMTPEKIYEAWNNIKIPERKTRFSAGYDICTPVDIIIPQFSRVVIPTGIKVVFNPDEMESWHLQMYVRSSVGIKNGVVLTNGTGIIDSDYQFADNDGDMMLALMNTTYEAVEFMAGDRICQAVFALHGITSNDFAFGDRIGGVGSTGR